MPSCEVLMGGRAAGKWADALKGERAAAAAALTGQEDEPPFAWTALPCTGSASTSHLQCTGGPEPCRMAVRPAGTCSPLAASTEYHNMTLIQFCIHAWSPMLGRVPGRWTY